MLEKHGGDRAGYKSKYGKEPLDFSANVSPLGLPKGVKEAVISALEYADQYPDPKCRALRAGLAKKLALKEEWILCGNGASDLIERLARVYRPKKALLTAPTFSEYADALRRVDCQIEEFLLQEKNGFHLTEEILNHIQPDTEILFLCEPNNPTGLVTERKLLFQIYKKCKEMDCLLVLDECFSDFLEEEKKSGFLQCLQKGEKTDHLLLLRAFTKFYGMAGIRLGYAISGEEALLAKMAEAGAAWPVSSLAQAAGLAALEEESYGRTLKALIKEERKRLAAGLEELGFTVLSGEANYLCFYAEDRLAGDNLAGAEQDKEEIEEIKKEIKEEAGWQNSSMEEGIESKKELREKLWEQGIMIRSCENYSGLGKGWYRIAVRGKEENLRLLKALKSLKREKTEDKKKENGEAQIREKARILEEKREENSRAKEKGERE